MQIAANDSKEPNSRNCRSKVDGRRSKLAIENRSCARLVFLTPEMSGIGKRRMLCSDMVIIV